MDFSWLGKPCLSYSRGFARAINRGSSLVLLRYALQGTLYENFYCTGGACPILNEETLLAEAEIVEFVSVLTESIGGQVGFCEDKGWRASVVRGDQVLIRRNGFEAWISRSDCLRMGSPLVPGARLAVRCPRQRPRISYGFFVVLGKKPLPPKPGPMSRWYWNLTVEGAAHFLQTATTILDSAGVSYTLKVPNHPNRFNRCDAGVIYLRHRDCEPSFKYLARIFAEVRPFLKEGTPALTRQIAPGLAWAEDPVIKDATEGSSFGSHRCYLLADAITDAFQRDVTSPEERLRLVKTRFAEEAIDLDRPFRTLRGPAVPALDELGARLGRSYGSTRPPKRVDCLFEAAQAIGEQIASDALWHGDMCNWLRPVKGPSGPEPVTEHRTRKLLGPDMYSGTAGVALFFAELCHEEADRRFRRVALGAIRHAIRCAEMISASQRLGLYTGLVGIAYAAVRVASVTGCAELIDESNELIEAATRQAQRSGHFDLLGGSAGAVVGLLTLQRSLGRSDLGAEAIRLGVSLLRTADKRGKTLSWKSALIGSSKNLTGFAHGTAGAAFALLELYQETRDERFWAAAEGAFEYERQCFDADEHNWPDYRIESKSRRRRERLFANCWSDGAPGIALSRVRAWEILENESYKLEAADSMQTVQRAILDWQRSHRGDWSLGSGLAGNCEILLRVNTALASGMSSDRSSLFELLRQAAFEHRRWQNACQSESPGLMDGSAGLGYLCLRASRPHTPSLLEFGRE